MLETYHRYKDVVESIERAVIEAARLVLSSIATEDSLTVQKKADNSLVTNLDVAAQEKILSVLGDRLPVVAEEDESSLALIHSEEDYFLVDPIDGTHALKRFSGATDGQVGFGPLVGVVLGGQLVASSFYNVPSRSLYTAIAEVGTFSIRGEFEQLRSLASPLERKRLVQDEFPKLADSAMLFYTGKEEMELLSHLKEHNYLETAYRFGSFANDSVRLAEGHEQIQLQFRVYPWDLAAVLFPLGAGYRAVLDPLGSAEELSQWEIKENNPVVIAAPEVMDALLGYLSEA